MSRYNRAPNDCKIYVGDLPKDASEKELEKAFSYFGRLRSVWVARNPPGFAFVEFEDYRDAEDAVKELDGTNICGARARVELSTGKTRPKPWQRGGRGRGPPRNRGNYSYDYSRSSGRRGSGGGSRRKSRSYSRERSYSRSRSRDHGGRSGRYSRSKSRSPPPKSRSRSPSQS